ncbi:MAG TPA: ABC transporter substrate-binding protein [Candidatus Limnocylindrales bacterium]|nr:ABC transporter substrate-binding protein [Candidatus Limnocylindrales bacterium]
MVRQRLRGSRAIAFGSAVLLVLGACAPGGQATPTPASPSPSPTGPSPAASASAPAPGGTVKVGFISPTTGFVAALGIDMKRGWELYWELHGTTAGGVTVETIFEDDTGDPDVALTKARRLVEEERVDMTAGPILANTAYAVAEYVAGQGVPSFHISGADDLTQRRHNPLVMRVGYTSSQSNFPAGQWAYDQGHRRAVTICPDYGFGWESCGGFVKAFVDAGGTIAGQIWHPLGTQDFGPYVSQVPGLDPDVVFVGSAGGPDAILFWQAWTGFGLREQPLIGNCCFADQVLLRDQGANAAGIQSFSYWTEGRESPVVQEFVREYESRHGEIPSLYAAGSYLMATVIASALEATGGRVEGAEFVAAARQLQLEDSVYGPIRFDEYNNIVGNVYREHVEDRGDGVYWNVVDEVFPNVSQFWTYDPQEYLSKPVFSREYTGQE